MINTDDLLGIYNQNDNGLMNILIYDPYLKKYYKVQDVRIKAVEDEYGYDIKNCLIFDLYRKGWDTRYEDEGLTNTDNYYWETFDESFKPNEFLDAEFQLNEIFGRYNNCNGQHAWTLWSHHRTTPAITLHQHWIKDKLGDRIKDIMEESWKSYDI